MAVSLTTSFEGDNNFFIFFSAHFAVFCPRDSEWKRIYFRSINKKMPSE
nr:MAG TPA_asm: hypothetical protein [Caudoviricetes sp.]